MSSTAFETIPTRTVVTPTSKTSDGFLTSRHRDRYAAIEGDVVYLTLATARCVAAVSAPPSQSGFGVTPDLDAITFPDVFVDPV